MRYTLTIVFAVCLSYFFPEYFIQIGDFKLKSLIVPLLQIIMFGMGTTTTFSDFKSIISTPKAVVIGLICQFTIMPLLGFGLTKVFSFPPEIAAGVILIGCSPSGLASNVMAYLAKANVALSITITTCATLLAPVFTPLLMKTLGGQYIDIDFVGMVIEILKIVIVPLAIGFGFNAFFANTAKSLQKVLPLVSMAGIALIIVVITAAGQKSLQSVGLTLIFAVLLHNLFGYFFGYFGAKICGLKEQDCRTVAIEVGLQNGGLASGLASQMGKLATVGLAPALFGPMMNITSSILANWWGRNPPKE
jgi:bile acid:Na+ symporter, BASS family